MFPLGFVVGAAAGAAGALLFGRHLVEHGRPLAKAALKATLAAMHEARVRGSEIGEAAEDLYAEAKSEVTTEIFEAAMAAAAAKAAEIAKASEMSKATAMVKGGGQTDVKQPADNRGVDSVPAGRTRAERSAARAAND